ncbi:uncharacterized protein PGTG_10427 [Puccinia graminis f. sp. tritici CRL 75-36-700-3]|uniref:Uncharacterized protein n=1 Tax=Puccinia graminis f. sp. tritici (strain CRL 75-36-700-3 / race SCCL) TaxID=418459 RepID=E3KKY1_PUCGT|nr:uncharacterized protein PGTG_10427 [Puccinia graminis f. sp. tritici CRL 75-36-700-3]EFP84956.1 hypothetical protein PGTG_10427 [Puccinia graminis f. sp. tritici CRL 75-36-700-3]
MKRLSRALIVLPIVAIGCNARVDPNIFDGLEPLIPDWKLWYREDCLPAYDAHAASSTQPTILHSSSAINEPAETSRDVVRLDSYSKGGHLTAQVTSPSQDPQSHETNGSEIHSIVNSNGSNDGAEADDFWSTFKAYEEILKGKQTNTSPETMGSTNIGAHTVPARPKITRKAENSLPTTIKKLKAAQVYSRASADPINGLEKKSLNFQVILDRPTNTIVTYRIDPTKLNEGGLIFHFDYFHNNNFQKIVINGDPEETLFLDSDFKANWKKLGLLTDSMKKTQRETQDLQGPRRTDRAERALAKLRSKHKIWGSYYRSRLDLKLAATQCTHDRLETTGKLLFSYLFLVDMISTILPRPSGSLGTSKAQVFKEALESLAVYDQLEMKMPLTNRLVPRGALISSMWRYLNHWLKSDEHIISLKVASPGSGILKNWKSFFNLVFTESLERLTTEQEKLILSL